MATALVETAMGMTTVTAVVAAYGSGVWGVYRHFVTKDKVEPWMNMTSALSLGGFLWFLGDRTYSHASTRPYNLSADVFSLGLIVVFMFLFWWTVATTRRQRLTLAFSRDKPRFIYTSGPYAWSRHPFYTSYIIFWVAAAAAADRLFWIMPFTMAVLYLRAAKIEEAKFADSGLSVQYDSYKVRTGMLFSVSRVFEKLGLGRDAGNDVSRI